MTTIIGTSKSFIGSLRQYIREFDPSNDIEDGGKSGSNLNKAWKDWDNRTFRRVVKLAVNKPCYWLK